MSSEVKGEYLNSIRYHLRLGYSTEKEIIRELSTHIDDGCEALREKGLSAEEAEKTSVDLMGSAKKVARQLYEAHSQGTWKQTLLAASPHLMVALLFALSWWPGVGWLMGLVTVIFCLAIYGWWRERPNWFFTWLGYSLIPVSFVGLLMFYLPRGWSWIGIIVYIPIATLLVYTITMQTIRRDWIYASLMLMPVPIVIAWVVIVNSGNTSSLDNIKYFGRWIGLSFLTLALCAALFIRIRQRGIRIALLLFSGIVSLTLTAVYASGRLNPFILAILMLLVLSLIIAPMILDHKAREDQI